MIKELLILFTSIINLCIGIFAIIISIFNWKETIDTSSTKYINYHMFDLTEYQWIFGSGICHIVIFYLTCMYIIIYFLNKRNRSDCVDMLAIITFLISLLLCTFFCIWFGFFFTIVNISTHTVYLMFTYYFIDLFTIPYILVSLILFPLIYIFEI